MGTIRDQIEKLDRLIEFVENELPNYAKDVLAAQVIGLVSERVVQTGVNFKGGKFTPYSTKTIPAYLFWGKSRTQTAERKVRALSRKKDSSGKKTGALSYDEFRGINNLKTGVKNFEFTGEMWRKLGVIKTTKSGTKFTVSIGGTSTAAQDKIDANSEREGISIIEANEREKTLSQQGAKEWLESNAKRILE